MIGKADLVTSVSESIVAGHNEAYGFAIGRFACIPSGGDPRPQQAFSDGVPAIAVGRHPLLVSVGVMAWDWKVAGHLVAVRAVDRLRHRHPRVLLLIAGDGPHRAIVEREIALRGLEDHVKMLGNVPPDPLLEAADIYVHMAMNEGCSLAIIEAMHAGKPIVAADAGGIPEVLVDGDSALLIEPEPQRLAAALQGLIEDEPHRRQLGARAREVALERYTWSIVARQYAEVYESLVKR
ncbi:MAG: glycosyltransferase family 4 protein [Frankiaceae bacterium]|nr:glycosyltransferase family 4 protein [Arenimonas sp.]